MHENKGRRTRRHILAGRLLLAAAALVAGCGKEAPPEKPVELPIKMTVFGGEGEGGWRSYPGKTQAARTADLAFENAGKLIELPVKRGQAVAKGDLIARIDPKDFENAVAARKAELSRAEADLERYRRLYEKDAVPLAELQVRDRNHEVAKANLQIAVKALADTSLRAPFAGLVARKFVENFENILAKQPVARLQDTSEFEVLINIPEMDVARAPDSEVLKKAKQGDFAYAEFAASPGRRFGLAVKEYESEADPATQSFLVKFFMAKPEGINIAPGMTATVRIDMSLWGGKESAAAAVPAEAVFSDERGMKCVWAVNRETMTVSRREVEVGELSGDSLRILGGLKSGEMIAVTGVHKLSEGVKVRSYERLMEPPQ